MWIYVSVNLLSVLADSGPFVLKMFWPSPALLVYRSLFKPSRAQLLLSQSNYPDWSRPPTVIQLLKQYVRSRISESAVWAGNPTTRRVLRPREPSHPVLPLTLSLSFCCGVFISLVDIFLSSWSSLFHLGTRHLTVSFLHAAVNEAVVLTSGLSSVYQTEESCSVCLPGHLLVSGLFTRLSLTSVLSTLISFSFKPVLSN